jgi:hypothetical protein
MSDSYADRAREDAFRDMLSENQTLQYTASWMVRHNETDEVEHGIIKQDACGVPEAVGLMYMELTREYEIESGWSPPSIILDDTYYAFDKGCHSGPCGTCGDPSGPCDDPILCIQNPGNSG